MNSRQSISLDVNGTSASLTIDDPTMPLLYALRDDLGLHGPRFGCGLAQCGACTVLLDGSAIRSCVFPRGQRGRPPHRDSRGTRHTEKPHPLQQAFIDEQAAQCGYCINGMIMQAAAFISSNKNPTEAQVKQALANNLCRCGTHSAHSTRRETRLLQRLMNAMSLPHSVSRREILKFGGLIVSFALPIPLMAENSGMAAAADMPKVVAPDRVDGFLAIDRHGNVAVFSGKVDLGTGVLTAITQIAAEELDVPMTRVNVIQGDTLLTPDQGPTYGSLSIQNGGMQIRLAAATARRALLRTAAQRLNIDEHELTVDAGVVKPRHGNASVRYGELVGRRTLALALDQDAPLKDPNSYTVVGRSQPRLDIPDKVNGSVYVYARLSRRGNGARARRSPPRHRR